MQGWAGANGVQDGYYANPTTTDKIVLMPTSGGSLPLSIITQNLRTVTMSVPIANYDNNQHAENENIRLQNLWDGIETFAALMSIK